MSINIIRPSYSAQYFANAFNPADATTYHVGMRIGTPSTSPGLSRIYFPRAGVIRCAYVSFLNVGTGTSETSTVSFRLNSTTDTTISSTVANNVAFHSASNTSLSITIADGDFFEIKWVTPTWVTNPTSVGITGHLVVEAI